MWISELWRYPVKSMAGEKLEEAEVTPNGIAGDRAVLVLRGDRVMTARSHPRLLRHQAMLGSDGQLLVDGLPWDSPRVAEWIESDAGPGARLIRFDGPERFDILPLLVATDGAIAALGEDGRRLRPNIVIGGVEGLTERQWEGKDLRIGAALIRAQDLRQRCVMTTYHPDTQEQDIGVLRRIVRDFDGSLALNCSVVEPAIVRLGEPVEVLEATTP
jgi:uncharacterized protein YcbX